MLVKPNKWRETPPSFFLILALAVTSTCEICHYDARAPRKTNDVTRGNDD
jgi:hypothetical protein